MRGWGPRRLHRWYYAGVNPTEQVQAIAGAADVIAARYPDDEQARHRALTAATAVIIGDQDLDQCTADLREVTAAVEVARHRFTGAVLAAYALGMTEQAITDLTGVSKATVRKALGKLL